MASAGAEQAATVTCSRRYGVAIEQATTGDTTQQARAGGQRSCIRGRPDARVYPNVWALAWPLVVIWVICLTTNNIS
jgi:hypothetical protein